jgi:hypothetical protein
MKPFTPISTYRFQQLFLGILDQNKDSFRVSDNNVASNAFKVGQQQKEVAGLNAARENEPFLLSNDSVSASNNTVSVLSFYGYVSMNSKKIFRKRCNII